MTDWGYAYQTIYQYEEINTDLFGNDSNVGTDMG